MQSVSVCYIRCFRRVHLPAASVLRPLDVECVCAARCRLGRWRRELRGRYTELCCAVILYTRSPRCNPNPRAYINGSGVLVDQSCVCLCVCKSECVAFPMLQCTVSSGAEFKNSYASALELKSFEGRLLERERSPFNTFMRQHARQYGTVSCARAPWMRKREIKSL